MSQGAPVIATKGLTVGYRQGKGESTIVARDLDLVLEAGQMVCLLGKNGTGKSTLIRALAGLEEPISGRIDLIGTDSRFLSRKERARLASVVLTDNAPVGLLTVYSLVALGRHPHTKWSGRLTHADRQKIDWALEAVGLSDLGERQVGELSDGERQKAMIARALAQDASALLLDEPTAFVDLPRRVELMQLLRELATREGLAVLLSSHDLDLCLRCADRLWLMKAGGSVLDGVPESLAMKGKVGEAFESDALDWDDESGGFRIRQSTDRLARVDGDGEELLWTKRMLARLGYSVSRDEGDSLDIRIENRESALRWRARAEGLDRRFKTLDELAEWLRLIDS